MPNVDDKSFVKPPVLTHVGLLPESLVTAEPVTLLVGKSDVADGGNSFNTCRSSDHATDSACVRPLFAETLEPAAVLAIEPVVAGIGDSVEENGISRCLATDSAGVPSLFAETPQPAAVSATETVTADSCCNDINKSHSGGVAAEFWPLLVETRAAKKMRIAAKSAFQCNLCSAEMQTSRGLAVHEARMHTKKH